MNVLGMSPGGIATLACLLEVSAPKPGNVHRGADFEDATLNDFLASAVAMGQAIDQHADQGIGQTVLAAVKSTKQLTVSNTNLGMILLLVPLAKVLRDEEEVTSASVSKLLAETIESDTCFLFEAIRLAQPGGLGRVDRMDVNEAVQDPSGSLLEAMELAADRDMIARQYTNGFQQVFKIVALLLVQSQQTFPKLNEAIVLTHLSLLAQYGDSLIERKCGKSVSNDAQSRAQRVLDLLPHTEDDLAHESFWNAVGDFDFWLRSDGHRRNPGTTADLIAAGLFVTLSSGAISAPFN